MLQATASWRHIWAPALPQSHCGGSRERLCRRKLFIHTRYGKLNQLSRIDCFKCYGYYVSGYCSDNLILSCCTVIRFVLVIAIIGTCTVVGVNWTLVEAKMFTFMLVSTHFIFNKCPSYTHDSASVKFSTNSHETDYSVALTLPINRCVSYKSPNNGNIFRRSISILSKAFCGQGV